MFAIGIPELLIGLVVLVGFVVGISVVVAVVAARAGSGRAAVPAELSREAKQVRLTRVAGVVLGIVAAVVSWSSGSYGLGAMLAPALFGLCVVLATALGETVVRPPRPTGVRSASLHPRRVADYLPRLTSGLVVVVLLASAVVMVLTTLTASRDTDTRTMRALSCSTPSVGSEATPYPGSYYTLPLTALLVVVLLVAALAARQVVRRPRGLAADDTGDDALRGRSLDVIVAAVGIAVSAPYVGLALTAGGALNGLGAQTPSCAPSWMHPTGIVIELSAVAALVVALVCLLRLLTGTTRSVAPQPEAARR